MPEERENAPEMPGYRLLTVKSVQHMENGKVVCLESEESAVLLMIEADFLSEKNVKDLLPGDQIYIKGKKGNSDFDLSGIRGVEDIKRA